MPDVGGREGGGSRDTAHRAEAALDHAGRADAGAGALDHLHQASAVARAHEQVEVRAHDVLDPVAEHLLDGRALVHDHAGAVEHGDQVARVLEQGAESGLAAAAVQIFGQQRALDRERHLGRQGLERPAHLAAVAAGEADEQEGAAGGAAGQADQGVVRLGGQAELLEQLAGDVDPPHRRAVDRPGGGDPRARGGGDGVLGAILVQADETGVGGGAGELAHGGGGGILHLVDVGGADQGDARAAQGALAGDRALLLAHEAGHAGEHEHEHDDGGDDHDDHVGVVPLLEEADARRDQDGHAQESEAHGRQPGAALRRLLERAHRRMQRGGAPEQVVEDPADIKEHLAVVGAVEQHAVVDRVGRQEADNAAGEQVEGRCADAAADREPDRGGEQEDVAHRVGDRDGLGQPVAAELDVRGDQEDPREQGDAQREDERVDGAGPVGARVAPPHEQEQAGHQRRVDGEVERVAGRGEPDVEAEQAGQAVGVEVAHQVERLAEGEEAPCDDRPGAVHAHAGQDGGHTGDAEGVDDRPVDRAAALELGHDRVEVGEERAGQQVPQPDGARRERPQGGAGGLGEAAHAASRRSSGRCSSKRCASRPRTSISSSISSSPLAAVTWIRNPTSSLGTSG
jgi:hypothetical protein